MIFDGRRTKADGTAYANADEVALTNNAIMHLFSRIEYHLLNQLIESLNYPGQATTMRGMLIMVLLQIMHISSSHLPFKGTFSFRIPLKQIFGFCEDYETIVHGLKHSLTLGRKTDDDAIFREAKAGAGNVSRDKISWLMLHVIPGDAEKFSIYKTIDSKVKLPVAYRTRQCDMLSVPELTSFTWRLSVKAAPKKDLLMLVSKWIKSHLLAIM